MRSWNCRPSLPTLIHAGSGPAPGRFTGPGPVAEVLRRHPNLRIPRWSSPTSPNNSTRSRPCSVTTSWLWETRSSSAALPRHPYPYSHAVESVIALGLGPRWCRKVLHDNAVQLFDLIPRTNSCPPDVRKVPGQGRRGGGERCRLTEPVSSRLAGLRVIRAGLRSVPAAAPTRIDVQHRRRNDARVGAARSAIEFLLGGA